MRNPISRITRPVLFALLATTLSAAQDRPQITVKTEKLADNLYMLHGAGGNLAAFAGPDGVLLIDSEYEQLSEEVIAAVGDLSDQPIRYVVNTHWHFDHVGGNKSRRGRRYDYRARKPPNTNEH